MNKDILNEYIDACELIKETEQDIARLKKKQSTVVVESVKGSMPEFPYAEQHFKIEGLQYNVKDEVQLRAEEQLLLERKENAKKIKTEVEKWMNTIPVRMQRIVRYKIFQRLSWEEVAKKMERNVTPDSVRMEYYNFMRKQK